MSEYKVQWRHLRYPTAVDWWWRLEKHNLAPTGQTERAIAKRSLRPAGEWQRGCTHLAQHGGKTECRIYQLCPPLYEATQMPTMRLEVASAEAICSWRDQFDRRVGRLYSLALALCELPIDLHTIELYATLNKCAGSASDDLWDQLCGYITLGDKTIVKRICAEIVQSWKRKSDANWGAAIKSFYREAMRLCDTAPDDLTQLEYWADLFDASSENWDAMATPILAGDKREVASIIGDIVAEWKRR